MPTLDAAVDQAAGLRRMTQPRPVKVIAVTGGKGGVGKSNVSANLALSLAALKRRVMVLDADLGLANVDVLLGLQPHQHLGHVLNGEATLEDVIVTGPRDVRIVPGASGTRSMANLSPMEHAGIIQAFSDVSEDVDVLLVDTAAGISDTVMSFAQAAHEVLVVVCDEPASITDAYALIKVLSRDYGVSRFRVVTNMTVDRAGGRKLFDKLIKVADRFLDVVLDHAGDVPYDEYLRRAVQQQTGVVEAFPGSWASKAFGRLAETVDQWETPTASRGHLEFFMERLYGMKAGMEEAVS